MAANRCSHTFDQFGARARRKKATGKRKSDLTFIKCIVGNEKGKNEYFIMLSLIPARKGINEICSVTPIPPKKCKEK